MKKFKVFYYPIIAVVMAAALVMGFVSAAVPMTKDKLGKAFTAGVREHLEVIAAAPHNASGDSAVKAQTEVRKYLISQLKEGGIRQQTLYTQREDDDQQLTDCDYQQEGGADQPTFFVQSDTVTQKTAQKISGALGGDKTIVPLGKEVNNIIVSIPGQKTLSGEAGDAVMMMANYDSWYGSDGAGDNGVSVASMLELIRTVVSEKRGYDNDLLFVFTDAAEEGLYGAFAFRYQFEGFDNIFSRVKLGTDFDGMGTGGALAVFGTSNYNYKVLDAYAKAGGGGSSAFTSFYKLGADPNDFAVYDDIASLNIANVGNANYYHTFLDDAGRVKDADLKAKANVMNNLIEAFGSYDLNKLESNYSGGYFSFLGWFTIAYSDLAAYITGGILLALMLAAAVVNLRKKAFSFTRLLAAMGVQLLTLASVFVALIAGYYLVAMLLSGFGVIPWRAVSTLIYANAGLIVGIMLLSVAAAAGFYALYKRLFAVKGVDLVRGAAVIIALLGAVLSFAAPSVGYIFALTGILEMVVLLVSTLLKDKYKQKYGEDIERLFLYTLPVIVVGLPLLVPVIAMLAQVLPSVYICMTALAFSLMAGTIMPYADFVKPILNEVFKKLPKRTIRVEKTVTERVEDKAKKGKFTERTVKKVTGEKVFWRYNHGAGVCLVALVAVVVMILTTSFSAGFGTAYAGSVSDGIYKDSLLYVWQKENTAVTHTLEVYDKTAYKFMRYAIPDLRYDSEKNAYVKDFSGNTGSIINTSPDFGVEDGAIVFTPYNNGGNSRIVVKLTDASSITKLTVVASNGDETEIENAGNDEIEILIPYGDTDYKTFKLEMESSSSSVNVEYSQYVSGDQADNALKNNLEEWQDLVDYYRGSDIETRLKCGMILKYNKTLTI